MLRSGRGPLWPSSSPPSLLSLGPHGGAGLGPLPSGPGPASPRGSLGPSSATCRPVAGFTLKTSGPLLLLIPWHQSRLSYVTAGHANASSSYPGSRPGSPTRPQALGQGILLISWLQARLLRATAGSKSAPPPHLLAPGQAPPGDCRLYSSLAPISQ